ncbi:MAG: vWA domain-containing protein, partial [Gemmataceae bacterium]
MISVPSSLLALAPEWSMETGLWGSLVLASVLVASFASWRGNTVLRTFALALALFVGGAFFPRVLAGYLLLGSGLVSLLFFLLLFLSGFWSRSWMMGCAAMMVLGLGGILLPGSPHNLAELGHRLASLRCHSPWWLLGLGLLPIVATLGWNRLASDDRRPWLTLALRLLGVTLLVLALADPFFAQAARSMTVLFVLDRSLSIPEELGEDPESPGVRRDLRALRIQNWINDCVAQRGAGREQDQAGLIVFGKQPRLELPPSDGPRFALRELPAADDGSATN